MENKIELLRDIVEDSKRYEFIEDEIEVISSYYNGNKRVGINFIALIEMFYECDIPNEYIDRILLNNDELEVLEND